MGKNKFIIENIKFLIDNNKFLMENNKSIIENNEFFFIFNNENNEFIISLLWKIISLL